MFGKGRHFTMLLSSVYVSWVAMPTPDPLTRRKRRDKEMDEGTVKRLREEDMNKTPEERSTLTLCMCVCVCVCMFERGERW